MLINGKEVDRIDITLYKRPNAEKSIISALVYSEDKLWYEMNGVELSMEDLGGDSIVLYADVGIGDEDSTPIEAILIWPYDKGDSELALSALRVEADALLDKYGDLEI